MQTKTKPIYQIKSFDFNQDTRVAHVFFLEIQQYRTIEKYVTRNYVKSPIYSDWKTKTKQIKKTVKLNNVELETLQSNPDPLIASFASEIVKRLGYSHLYPSWFRREQIRLRANEEIANAEADCKGRVSSLEESNKDANRRCLLLEKELVGNQKASDKANKKLVRLNRRKTTLSSLRHPVILTILTFGFLAIFLSKGYQEKLDKRIVRQTNICDDYQKTKERINESISLEKAHIVENKAKADIVLRKLEDRKREIADSRDKELADVMPLLTNAASVPENGFVSLKSLCGMPSEKIIGCYVIRNRQNGRCYCGQSKDVLKRITKQHFQGTKPNNIIFAEDYFSADLGDRDDLFEVRIIRCTTKDELDFTEKSLIEEYDSFLHGYNGTAGNS